MKEAYNKTDGVDDPLSFPRLGPVSLLGLSNCLPAQTALQWRMAALTRRGSPDAPDEFWHVYFGDVRVGTIAIRTGMAPLANIRGAGPVASIRLAAGR